VTFDDINKCERYIVVKCADGKVGWMICWYVNIQAVGVQVPDEPDIREISAGRLSDGGGGILVEESASSN
jgi:hypothetical protein